MNLASTVTAQGSRPASPRRRPARGLVLGVTFSLAAGIFLSTGGIALRLIESAGGFQILFYRAATFLTVMVVVLGLGYRRRAFAALVGIGGAGLAASFLLGVGAVAYVLAILNTTVANAVVILSTSPLLAAFVAWLMFGKRASWDTLIASSFALLGVCLMVVEGLSSGGLLGMLIALGAAGSYALMLVIMRHSRRDMLPATALSGVFTLAIAALLSPDLAVSLRDLSIGIFLGAFQFGLGFILVTLATRHVDGDLIALLTLSEVVLAPLWVWVGVGEAPGPLALAGGLIVLAAVAGQIGWKLQRRR